jgi:hypothetical protein
MRRLTKVDGTGFLTYHLDGVGVKSLSAMHFLSYRFSDSISLNQNVSNTKFGNTSKETLSAIFDYVECYSLASSCECKTM